MNIDHVAIFYNNASDCKGDPPTTNIGVLMIKIYISLMQPLGLWPQARLWLVALYIRCSHGVTRAGRQCKPFHSRPQSLCYLTYGPFELKFKIKPRLTLRSPQVLDFESWPKYTHILRESPICLCEWNWYAFTLAKAWEHMALYHLIKMASLILNKWN